MKIFSRYILVVMLVLVATAVSTMSTFAINDPDSTPEIIASRVYRHIIEDNDILFEIVYKIRYGTLPEESPEESYFITINDPTTGAVIEGVNAPYFNYAVVYIYAAAGHSYVWDTGYTINLTESAPPFDAPAEIVTRTLSFTDYVATTTQQQTSIAFKTIFTATAIGLQTFNGEQYIQYGSLGPVLTPIGENFFSKVLPNLSQFVPSLFQIVVIPYELEEREHTNAFADSLLSVLDGTDIKNYADIWETATGMTALFFTSVFVLILYVTFVGLMTANVHNNSGGWMVIGIPIIVWGAWGGLIPLQIIGIMITLITVSAAYFLWFRSASP